MRLIAYYQLMTPSLVRRLIGNMAVLATRGHACHYSFIQSPAEMTSANYPVILLPDWSYLRPLPSIRGSYVYDLSDGALLHDAGAMKVISQCAAVLTPTEELAQRVRSFARTVRVTPSSVYQDWLFSTKVPRTEVPLLGCLGTYDWTPYVEILKAYLKTCDTHVLTSSMALADALPETRVHYVPDALSLSQYPSIIRQCFLSIVPGYERVSDPGVIFEYALAGVVPLVGPAYTEEMKDLHSLVCPTPDRLLHQLTEMTSNERLRAQFVAQVQQVARARTSVRLADAWLHTISKCCVSTIAYGTL